MTPIRWVLNVLVGLDEEGNALTGGDPRHTISARTGYALYRKKAWAKVAGPLINTLMGSKTHCIDTAVSEGLLTQEQAATLVQ